MRARIEKVCIVASSKKTGSSKDTPAKSNTPDPKVDDKVVAQDAVAKTDPLPKGANPKDADPKDSDPKEKTTKASSVKAATESNAPVTPGVARASKTSPDAVAKDTPKAGEKPDQPAATEKTAPASKPAPEKQSVFLPMVLGGIVAGVLGFMAAQYDVFETADTDMIAGLQSDLTRQQDRIETLEQAEPAAPVVDFGPIEDQLAALEARVRSLEERPAITAGEGMSDDAAAAYGAELEALKEAAETQRAEIEALISNARSVEEATADAARSANGQAAIAKIVSAIDAGQPFEDAVTTLQTLDLGELDPTLTGVADTGVATLSSLQADFPNQARSALAAARSAGGEEGQQGIGGFLTRSLGVRSVEPREGDDPDAVLSRAEAAVRSGDLADALKELDTLPEEAQAVLADWREAARARVSARTAADALAQRLTAD
jgi:hypothetical protein